MKTKLYFFLLIVICLPLATCKKDLTEAIGGFSIGNGLGKPKTLNCLESLPVFLTFSVTDPDFGAIPDDGQDDSHAFIRAAKYLEILQSVNNPLSAARQVIFQIPVGTYNVGIQLEPCSSLTVTGVPLLGIPDQTFTNPCNGFRRLGLDMMYLPCLQNIQIVGIGGVADIVYDPNMYFGTFDFLMQPINSTDPPPPNPVQESYCSIGDFIYLDNTNCVEISSIRVDGNADDLFTGGHIGTWHMQTVSADAIRIGSAVDVSIISCGFSYMCRDGILMLTEGAPCAHGVRQPDNIYLDNLDVFFNIRTGFAWAAGTNVRAVNCDFNYTGRVVWPTGGTGAGMDIEPEFHDIQGVCFVGYFDRCGFEGNAGAGVIQDNHYPLVKEIEFNLCNITAGLSNPAYALWFKRTINANFTECTIRGGAVHLAGTSPTDMLSFERCTFDDSQIQDYDGSPYTPYSQSQIILNLGASPPDNYYFLFHNCRFNLHYSKLVITGAAIGQPPAEDLRVFDRCAVYLSYNDITPVIPPPTYLGIFRDCTLKSNVFEDLSPVPNFPSAFFSYWLGVTFPTDPQVNPFSHSTSDGNNVLVHNGNPLWGHITRNWDSFANQGNYFSPF